MKPIIHRWRVAIRESSLSPTARHVALTISTYMNKDGAGAWPHMGTLASDTGRSRAVVKRAVRELRDAGYLEVDSGGGRRPDGGYVSNRYTATEPVSGVVDEPPNGSSGVVGEPDTSDLGGSFHEGTGSSGEGAGSWTVGSGVVDDPRTTKNYQSTTKQHSAAEQRAPDGATLSGLKDKDEGQDPVESSFQSGQLFGADPKISIEVAGEMLANSPSVADHDAFWKGFAETRQAVA